VTLGARTYCNGGSISPSANESDKGEVSENDVEIQLGASGVIASVDILIDVFVFDSGTNGHCKYTISLQRLLCTHVD
jgi:hypothetical protein